MKILCGVVTYNPDISLLKINIEEELKQTDEIVIVDNYSNNIRDIIKLASDRVHIIANKKNKGIAYALNQIIRYANNHGYEWVLTMDQDSTIYAGLIDNYLKYVNCPNVAMINCKHNDRNYDDKRWYAQKEDVVEVNSIITSGTLTKVKPIIECGGFDNKMFIDQVDKDMCATLREHGYKIYETNFVGYMHMLGRVTTKRLFLFSINLYHYSPYRIYHYTRNSIYFIRKHHSNYFILLTILRLAMGSVFFEDNKTRKLMAYIRGIFDGINMRIDNK